MSLDTFIKEMHETYRGSRPEIHRAVYRGEPGSEITGMEGTIQDTLVALAKPVLSGYDIPVTGEINVYPEMSGNDKTVRIAIHDGTSGHALNPETSWYLATSNGIEKI